jgi:membrane-bound serine protease (ClpP class)
MHLIRQRSSIGCGTSLQLAVLRLPVASHEWRGIPDILQPNEIKKTMDLTRLFVRLILAVTIGLTLCSAASASEKVLLIRLDGTINPASAAYLERGIAQAREMNAACVIIELNTPGGLLKSTRVIVTAILESNVPVVVYVAPPGAQSGSAGVFITLAAHVAAMAPGTNIGAAHPVNLQGGMDSVMSEKTTNDAAAFIRSIAEKRNRNLTWAEDAVRKSQSITETEALNKNVIDLVAKNVEDLLIQLNGRQVSLPTGTVELRTAGARVEAIEMGWTERLLDILSDPNIAYILLMLGMYGLLFELYNPGSIFPGVVGVISLILAFYSLHTLPVNYAGLALIVFGVVLFLLEVKIISHGLLTIGGIISLFLGSIMLIRTPSMFEVVELSLTVIIASVVVTTLFFTLLLTLGIRAQRLKPTTGSEGLVGEIGEATSDLAPAGTVRVHGELWKAESVAGNLTRGEKVRVVSVQNLILRVERTN